MLKITDATKVAIVPVKTRLPLAAWALAGLVTLFSMVSSFTHAPASPHASPASFAEAAGLVHTNCDKAMIAAAAH